MLDFTNLSDEQLLELTKNIMQEIGNRGTEMLAAGREIMLTEKEKADIAASAYKRAKEEVIKEEKERIAREAAEKARAELRAKQEKEKAQKVSDRWQWEKEHAEKLRDLFNQTDLYLTVWNGRDKRIYFKEGDFFSGKEIAVYYCTGNDRHRPGKLTLSSKFLPEGADQAEFENKLTEIFQAYCKKFSSGKFDISEALAA